MTSLGKLLIAAGVAIVLLGVALLFFDRLPFIGRLPGDILIKRKNYAIYFPLMTCIVLSLLLTLILFIINITRK
jgi:hypothetical protein